MSQIAVPVRDRLAEACLELLQIASPTGQEDEIIRYLKRWALSLRQLAPDSVLKLGNALIVGQPDERRPCIALVGHVDTVPGHPDDGSPTRDGDRIVGLGASDMKGGLALMQVLFETLNLASLPFAVVLVFYDREEGPYADNGLEPLLNQVEMLKAVDFAIALEPTDNTLQLGCLGSLHARLTFQGRAAHSARPWQGENAIHKAGPLLAELARLAPRDVDVDGLVFRETLSVTSIRGGHARNVVPDRCELNLNYRFAPRAPVQRAIDGAVRDIHRLAAGASVEITDISPPGPVPRDNPLLAHVMANAQLRVEPKQAWTDVARLAVHGIDAVNFGPGSSAQAHQRGEWISHQALVQAYSTLRRVLTTPLAG